MSVYFCERCQAYQDNDVVVCTPVPEHPDRLMCEEHLFDETPGAQAQWQILQGIVERDMDRMKSRNQFLNKNEGADTLSKRQEMTNHGTQSGQT